MAGFVEVVLYRLLGVAHNPLRFRREFPVSSWAVVYSATVLALAYAVPKLAIIWWQAKMVNLQIDQMTSNSSAEQTQFTYETGDFPSPYA